MSENVIEEAAKVLRAVLDDHAHEYSVSPPVVAECRRVLASLRKAAEGARVRWLDRWSLYDYDRKVPGCKRVLVLPIPEPGKEPR